MSDHHHPPDPRHTHSDQADVPGGGRAHQRVFDDPEMVERAELEAEVLGDLLAAAIDQLAATCQSHGVDVRHVLDVGSGPGVGTVALAERFPGARVVAADGSAAMLERAAERAARRGVADRVEVRRVDLSDGLDHLGTADVVWASMVLHHVGDEADALRRLADRLAPGGVLALVEREDPLQVRPVGADPSTTKVWGRLDTAWAAWFAHMRADLPGATRSGTYREMLAGAGLSVVADEVITADLAPPLDAPARRFVHRQLLGTRRQLDGHAERDDLVALDALIDELAGGTDAAADAGIDAHLGVARRLYLARQGGVDVRG